jgi:hypothetical protein
MRHELKEMKMADGCGCEPEVIPPAISAVGVPTPFEGVDLAMTMAVNNVAAVIDRLARMNVEDAPTNPSYAETLEDGRIAMLELAETPAHSSVECNTKLAMLDQMALWFQEGDPDILHCFVSAAHENAALLQQVTDQKSGLDGAQRSVAFSRSVRWFLGIAAAVPSAVFSRWGSGGVG